MKRSCIYLPMIIGLLMILISCSKESEVVVIYPEFNAVLNYDSASLKFPNSRSSLGGLTTGMDISGCLRREDGQRFCLSFEFDTMISSFDFIDSIQGKVFYFISNENYPRIKLTHEIDEDYYNSYTCEYNADGDYFLLIEEINKLPLGDPFNNVQFVPYEVRGSFKSRLINRKGIKRESTGKFSLFMEHVRFLP